MRLIDADALDAAFTALRFNADGSLKHWGDRPDWCVHGNEVEMLIKDAPTIDPVKHGRWVKRTDENCWWYECSECGDYPMKNAYGHEELSAYCPHCGARMDEVTE